MKTTIKVKLLNKKCKPCMSKKGDWIDLRASESYTITEPCLDTSKLVADTAVKEPILEPTTSPQIYINKALIPLGVAIKLPKGFEAVMVMRSGSYKHYKIIMLNSLGVIDNNYCGDRDEWMVNVAALEDSHITEGDRICQFKIQLSQYATMWQKLKWMFSSGVKIEYVKKLGNKNRGGFGKSGKK